MGEGRVDLKYMPIRVSPRLYANHDVALVAWCLADITGDASSAKA